MVNFLTADAARTVSRHEREAAESPDSSNPIRDAAE
jgi:hypothetical protein